MHRDRLAAGEITIDRTTRRGNKPNPDLLTPVPKCGLPHASKRERVDCPRCKRRRRYTSAIQRHERRNGIDLTGLVDAAEVVKHVTEVLEPAGYTQERIAELSGVGAHVISRTVRGAHKRMTVINARAILSVQPEPYLSRGRGDTVNVTGVHRWLRGLYAQGWSVSYMAELLDTNLTNLWHLVGGIRNGRKTQFVSPATVEKVQWLVNKLGPFDIAQLPEPMDGMSNLCASRAGWVTLDAWENLDIDDPATLPHGHDALPTASNGMVLVDPGKIELALASQVIETLDRGTGVTTYDVARFPVPLTKLELHELIRVGSALDHAGNPKLSANVLHQLTGISERSVIRIRGDLGRAGRLLDDAPPLSTLLACAVHAAKLILATEEWPWQTRLAAVTTMLGRYPINRGFFRSLVILGATQPAPYGRGWTDQQLADWLGATLEEATALRARAVLAGRQYQNLRPRTAGRGDAELATAA